MRTIKFRGKRIDNEEWVYGYYYMYPLNKNPINDHHYIVNHEWEPIFGGYLDKRYQIDPDTLGQFTGFKDSKGTEVYENDIIYVVYADKKYFIKYEDGSFNLYHTDPKMAELRWGSLSRLNELGWEYNVI
jgi:uncharacterized phage protein (TIGR01671 family)